VLAVADQCPELRAVVPWSDDIANELADSPLVMPFSKYVAAAAAATAATTATAVYCAAIDRPVTATAIDSKRHALRTMCGTID
jgi:3-hydroxyisobutyrate dehydrogenase-like beta-hydroxyacid dehydrogenase